jgi:hypothetical protein
MSSESDLSGSGFTKLADGTFADTSSVDYIVNEIKDLLAIKAPSGVGEDGLQASVVDGQFTSLLSQLGSRDLVELKAELAIIKNDIQDGDLSALQAFSQRGALPALPKSPHPTSIFSSAGAPYCVVFGPGPVGLGVLSRLKALEPAVKNVVKRIDGDNLATMLENELTFALRDVRTVIVAAETLQTKATGWFAEEPTPLLNQKSM